MHLMAESMWKRARAAFVCLFNYFMSLGKCNSLFKRDVAENTECFPRQKWSSCHIYVIQNDGLIRFQSLSISLVFFSMRFCMQLHIMYKSHPIVGFSNCFETTKQSEFPFQHYFSLSLSIVVLFWMFG